CFDRLDVDHVRRFGDFQRLPWLCLLERRSLEDAKTSAPIALDAHEVFSLTRLQQIHQAIETAAALVEPTFGLSKDLLHVTQVHRPPRAGGGGENPSGALHAFSRARRLVWRRFR